jgi:hypothetical protein
MADFFPFDSGQGSNVTEAQWGLMAQNWLGTGVLKGKLNEFLTYADSTGMQVKVKSGQAWIQGFFFQVVTESVIPISPANSTNPRIDRIAIQVDWTNNNISLIAIQGTPAASPIAPALTQNTSIWQISLTQVYVGANVSTIAAGNISDERVKVKNTNDLSTPWYDLVLQNGWVNFGSGFANAQYRLNEIGKLELRGRIKSGSVAIGATIATLPTGFRPVYGSSYSINTSNGGGLTLGDSTFKLAGTLF